MFDLACCGAPIILATLTVLSLVLWLPRQTANDGALSKTVGLESIDQDNILATNRGTLEHLKRYWLIAVAGAVLVLSVCFFSWGWVKNPDVVLYWELFHFRKVLSALLFFSIISTVLIQGAHLTLRYLAKSNRSLQPYSTYRLVANYVFLVASAFFWIAFLPYGIDSWKQVDNIVIDGSIYNLVSYEQLLEQHSGLVLFKCDPQEIFCLQIARSRPDYCVSSVDGRLVYDSSTNELSAEVFSCVKYVGFTYHIKGPTSSSED